MFTGPGKRDGKGWCFFNAEFYSGGDEMGRLKAGADRGLQLSGASLGRCQQFLCQRHLGRGGGAASGCASLQQGQFWGLVAALSVVSGRGWDVRCQCRL